jgi:hypothetical protein
VKLLQSALMSGDPDNRDAQNAFGGDAPASGADAFGNSGFRPPSSPPASPPPVRPQSPSDPDARHGQFAPPEVPGGAPIAPPPQYEVPPPPPPQQPPTGYRGPQPTSTWGSPNRVVDPATTPGHSSTWPPPDLGYKPRNADGATASLVLGILSWVICPIILSVVAIILARQARNEIDNSPTPLGGRDNASAGFWLGISSLVVYALFVGYVIIAGGN